MKRISEFINNLRKLFDRYYPMSVLILLGLIVVVALWQVSNLYFWTDDWDLFLRITHPNLELWGMEPGWFGSGRYRYLPTPFMPLFPIFGLNPTPYFIGSIFVYFLATVSVFLLFLEITRKRSLAIGAAAIYGSLGYIGSYTIFHLSNSYQNLGAVIFTTLTLWILAKHYRTNNFLYYLLSIFLFYVSLEVENLRAHGLILLVLGLTILFGKWKKSIGSILLNLAKIIPFILIYRNLYSASLGLGQATTIGAFFYTMGRDKVFAYFINPFANFSNVIIPDNITKFIYNFFGNSAGNVTPEIILVLTFILVALFFAFKNKSLFPKCFYLVLIVIETAYFFFNQWAIKQPILSNLGIQAGFTSMLGTTLLLSLLLISFKLWSKENNISKLLLFGIILIFGHYIGYFVDIPGYSYLITTDRYLTPSVVGTALVLGVLFYIIRINKFKKISLFPILCSLYGLYLIILMNVTAYAVVNNVSNPTKRIHNTIRHVLPSLPKHAILLLDFEDNPNLRYQMNSSFPPTAFALFYGTDNRVPSIHSFEEYLYKVKNNEMKIEDLVSLYISQRNVVNTTKTVQSLMRYSTEEKLIDNASWSSNTPFSKNPLSTGPLIIQREKDSLGVNPKIHSTINYPSVVPMMLSLTLTARPINADNLKFPYVDVSNMIADEAIKEDIESLNLSNDSLSKFSCKDVPDLIQSAKDHEDFTKFAKVSTASETKYSEKDFLTDGLLSTNWSGFVLHWNYEKEDYVLIDLGQVRNINNLIWVNYSSRTAPITYDILVSTDEKTWTKAKEVKNGPAREEGEFVVEDLGNQSVRFVKMAITNTSSNLAPSISEMWVGSMRDHNIKEYYQQLVDRPLSCPVNDADTYKKIENALSPLIKARLWWLTDSRENYSEFSSKNFDIITDGLPHTYNLYIPAQGTMLEKIMLSDFQLPLSVTVNRASIRSLTFREIDDLGYIRKPTGSSN